MDTDKEEDRNHMKEEGEGGREEGQQMLGRTVLRGQGSKQGRKGRRVGDTVAVAAGGAAAGGCGSGSIFLGLFDLAAADVVVPAVAAAAVAAVAEHGGRQRIAAAAAAAADTTVAAAAVAQV